MNRINKTTADKYRAGRYDYGHAIIVAASGRSTCRECGRRIAKGSRAVETFHDFNGSGSYTATKINIHADPCPAEPFDLDEFRSLEKVDRDALAELVRSPFTFADARKLPDRFRPLVAKGLAFHSHGRVSVTEKGLEVAERVG